MKRISKAFFALAPLALLTGCGLMLMHSDHFDGPLKLHKVYASLNIALDLPDSECHEALSSSFETAADGQAWKELELGYKQTDLVGSDIPDTHFKVALTFLHLDAAAYQQFKIGRHAMNQAIWGDPAVFHAELTKSENAAGEAMRKDFRNGDEYVLAAGHVDKTENPRCDEDVKTMEAMLNSVSFIAKR